MSTSIDTKFAATLEAWPQRIESLQKSNNCATMRGFITVIGELLSEFDFYNFDFFAAALK